ERFTVAPRTRFGREGAFRIITVGSMEDFRKGQDILLDAMASCVSNGLDVRLSVVGSGRIQGSLEARARDLGLKLLVNFTGQLSPERVVAELDRSDLFVLASRGEGLPRALLEGMARGLPAIGSHVGGFPEVLPASDLVRPGDVAALANKLWDIFLDVGRMRDMSARNLVKAREYHQEVLCKRRVEFYRAIRQRTEAWLVKA
ncbi:MAG TPA: glycosyltransferase family 4 protein, partial [Nitrospira sp.]|nr:glycosyltransferase family 4 protein [Nitrospira sp.]